MKNESCVLYCSVCLRVLLWWKAGLVNAYLQGGKYREAGFAAKEANEVMPGDARTVLLTGNVWEHIKGGMTDNRHKASVRTKTPRGYRLLFLMFCFSVMLCLLFGGACCCGWCCSCCGRWCCHVFLVALPLMKISIIRNSCVMERWT